MVERREAAEWCHRSVAPVNSDRVWIREFGRDLWILTEIDEDGVESYLDALLGDFLEVSSAFTARFPGRALHAALGNS